MKEINYKLYSLEKESVENMISAGRFNPATELHIFDKVITLGIGDSDSLSIYQEEKEIYILSENSAMEYISLLVFDLDTEKKDEIFLQDDNYLPLEDLGEIEKIEYLCQWFY